MPGPETRPPLTPERTVQFPCQIHHLTPAEQHLLEVLRTGGSIPVTLHLKSRRQPWPLWVRLLCVALMLASFLFLVLFMPFPKL